jgi:hypothetical protein
VPHQHFERFGPEPSPIGTPRPDGTHDSDRDRDQLRRPVRDFEQNRVPEHGNLPTAWPAYGGPSSNHPTGQPTYNYPSSNQPAGKTGDLYRIDGKDRADRSAERRILDPSPDPTPAPTSQALAPQQAPAFTPPVMAPRAPFCDISDHPGGESHLPGAGAESNPLLRVAMLLSGIGAALLAGAVYWRRHAPRPDWYLASSSAPDTDRGDRST